VREVPPGFVREQRAGACAWVRADLMEGARALGLLERDGVSRAFAAGVVLAGGRAPAAVLRWPDGARELVVRRLRHGGALRALLRGAFLGPGRVLRELAVNAELRRAGAPVPAPAFALAQRLAGPLWECAIATERAEDVGLARVLAAGDPARAQRALGAAARAIRRFHDAGGRHADLNVANLLLAPRGDEFDALVIDLDRARITAPVPPSCRMRELARLYRSLVKRGAHAGLGASERDAFLAAYCAGDAALHAALLAHLPRERARFALHAWRYRRP
jgi:3-deoxy-D-manno-octulosonic acid kinase